MLLAVLGEADPTNHSVRRKQSRDADAEDRKGNGTVAFHGVAGPASRISKYLRRREGRELRQATAARLRQAARAAVNSLAGPRLTIDFDVSAKGKFPGDEPTDAPLLTNSSPTEDALNVEFEPMTIGERRAVLDPIPRVAAGTSVPISLSVYEADGSALLEASDNSMAVTIGAALFHTIWTGYKPPTLMTFTCRFHFNDYAGNFYEADCVFEFHVKKRRMGARFEGARRL